MPEQLANVYLQRGNFLLLPLSRLIDGGWVNDEPVHSYPLEVSDHELGIAITEAISQSRGGVPTPTNWKAVLAPLLAAAGVRSWSAFQRSAQACLVECLNEKITIVPTTNGGATTGYSFLRDDALTVLTRCPPEELGSAIRRTMAACK